MLIPFLKIVSRPTPSTTHIVFKSGHQSTLTKYKLYEDPQPFLVGIGWVVECVEKRARVGEENFMIKTDEVSALDLKKVPYFWIERVQFCDVHCRN